MQFEDLRLIQPLLRALHEEGYAQPTPIQQQAVPPVLDGRDVLGCAQTGTGKTAAFALPILQRLHETPRPGSPGKRAIRALVLTPTRELAAQVADCFTAYGRHLPLKHATVFGGVSQHPQVQALRAGIDVLVATPGRLLDLMQQGFIQLHRVEVFVLDEADRMLDMGFIHDIRKVIAELPPRRQNLLFSATMPDAIRKLADDLLDDPVSVRTAPTSSAAQTVHQSVCHVDPMAKGPLLKHLLTDDAVTRALVFTRTKRRADHLTRKLERDGIRAEAIHSDKSQNARMRALDNFKRGRTRVLVASDLAARGVDVDNISHVFNFDLPGDAETYVHRIGRTGRAGMEGKAISFCTDADGETFRAIERHLGARLHVIEHGVQPAAHEAGEPKPHARKVRHHPAPAARDADAQPARRKRRRRRRRHNAMA